MLKLSRTLSVRSDRSPIIRPGDVLVHSCVDHRLNRKHVAGLHEASCLVVGVVRNVRGAMEEVANAMAAVSTID